MEMFTRLGLGLEMSSRLGLGRRCPPGWSWEDVPQAGVEMSKVAGGVVGAGVLADGGCHPQ